MFKRVVVVDSNGDTHEFNNSISIRHSPTVVEVNHFDNSSCLYSSTTFYAARYYTDFNKDPAALEVTQQFGGSNA